jgi:hypothetical protein
MIDDDEVGSMKRRDFLKLLAAGGIASLARPRPVHAATSKPHYIVSIMLAGGYDSVATVDPKDASTIGPGIDCGYRGDQRKRGETGRLFGPLIGELLRFDRDLCLIHGVRTDSVAHQDGMQMCYRGRATYSGKDPLIGDIIGAALPGNAPIDHLFVAKRLDIQEPIASRDHVVLLPPSSVKNLANPDSPIYARTPFSEVMQQAHAEEARKVLGRAARDRDDYLRSLAHVPQLRQFLQRVERPARFHDPQFAQQFQTALDGIRQNLARYYTLSASILSFDSHTDNFRTQEWLFTPFAKDLASFVEVLKTERNAFGPLYDQTTIVVFSEFGRYPKLNVTNGKDHWPENTWFLLGSGIRAGVTIGATDPQLRGTEVDFRSGRPSSEQRPIFIENVYAALLKLAGGDPRAAGYRRDAALDCVLAA